MRLGKIAILAGIAVALTGVLFWGELRDDPKLISGGEIKKIRLASGEPPPSLEIASIPPGAVAVYVSNTELRQHHFYLPSEGGLYPVERRNIGSGSDLFVDRILYDAEGVVRKVTTEQATRSYPEGRCEKVFGPCRYKARHEEGGTWGTVRADISVSREGVVRRRLDLGAGAMTVTYTISNHWGIARTVEWAGDNGSYSAIELLEIRLP